MGAFYVPDTMPRTLSTLLILIIARYILSPFIDEVTEAQRLGNLQDWTSINGRVGILWQVCLTLKPMYIF